MTLPRDLDLQKGDQIWIAFVEQLREHMAATVPIVLSSGRAFTFETERYLKAGIDRCIAKPMELSELARALADALPVSSAKAKSEQVRSH